MAKPTGLRYRGKGRFVVGVPATDLSADDVARLGGADPAAFRARLIKTGVYAPALPEKPAPKEA